MTRPFIRAEVLGPEAPCLVAIRGQDAAGVVGAEPPVHERGIGEAEGEHRPDARLLERRHRGVGMLGRVHDVGPVDERRDAGVDAFECTPLGRRVDVLRSVVRGELVEDRAEVGDQGEVGGAGPDARLPCVPMGVDEAGDDDVAGRIDDPGVVGRQVGADRSDLVVHDQDVRLRHLAELGVLGQHDPAAYEDSISHSLCLSPSRLGQDRNPSNQKVSEQQSRFHVACPAPIRPSA